MVHAMLEYAPTSLVVPTLMRLSVPLVSVERLPLVAQLLIAQLLTQLSARMVSVLLLSPLVQHKSPMINMLLARTTLRVTISHVLMVHVLPPLNSVSHLVDAQTMV
jgi:cell division inhibitor SulA